ncbi:MAG TPA: hypothetical protein VIV27_07840, partial [Halioglobus sp.]
MNTVRRVQRFFMVISTACVLVLAGCDGDNNNNNNSRNMQSPTALTLSVAPASIGLGQSATITWEASADSICTASGAWSGTKSASGSEVVTPTAVGTETYTLDCAGSGIYFGTVTNSTTLTVSAATVNEYSISRLVGDTAAAGPVTVDPNLVNPWGIAFGPATPVWVANNHSDTSTLYDG